MERNPTERLLFSIVESENTDTRYIKRGRIKNELITKDAKIDTKTKSTNNEGNQNTIFSVDGCHLFRKGLTVPNLFT